MKDFISKKVLKNLTEQVDIHNEILSGMEAVSERHHLGNKRIASKIGAIGYSGSVASGWTTFLMPDLSTKFGTVGSSEEGIEVDVSDIVVFGDTKTIRFQEDNGKWKKYFNVSDVETVETISKYTLV